MQEIKIKTKGILRLNDQLNNVDYYIGDTSKEENNLSLSLKSLVGKEIEFKLRALDGTSGLCCEGTLDYIQVPKNVKKLYIFEDQGDYFDLDSALWNLVDKEVEIQVNTITNTSIIKDGSN